MDDDEASDWICTTNTDCGLPYLDVSKPDAVSRIVMVTDQPPSVTRPGKREPEPADERDKRE